MRHGASHVAERALQSTLPAVGDHEYPVVMLLLAESLQEQGRWPKLSLDRLAEIKDPGTQDLEWRAVVLKALARVNLGASLSEETRAEIPLLETILRESEDGLTRVASARVLARFASSDRDAANAAALLPLVNQISWTGLDEDAQGQLALTKGMLLWLAGDNPESLRVVEEGVDVLRRRGTENTVAVQLLIGLGTLRMHRGEYEAAQAHYFLAVEMAGRLGNDTQIATILGNLAIGYGRLGDFGEQLRVSTSAPRPWGGDFGGFSEVQLTYSQALALVMLGRQEEAFEAVAELDARLQGAYPSWVSQAWMLWKADLMHCAGRRDEARAVASRALYDFDLRLQSSAFAGPFARWTACLSAPGPISGNEADTLKALLAEAGTYDALDQVEIMCAAVTSGLLSDTEEGELYLRIRTHLDRLPAGVADHLQRLGVLPLSASRLPEVFARPTDAPRA